MVNQSKPRPDIGLKGCAALCGHHPNQISCGTCRKESGNCRCDGQDYVYRTERGYISHRCGRRARRRSWRSRSTCDRSGGSSSRRRWGAWRMSRRRGAQCRSWRSRGRSGSWPTRRECWQLDRRRGRGFRRQINPNRFFLGLDFTGLLFRRYGATWNVGNILSHKLILPDTSWAAIECQTVKSTPSASRYAIHAPAKGLS